MVLNLIDYQLSLTHLQGRQNVSQGKTRRNEKQIPAVWVLECQRYPYHMCARVSPCYTYLVKKTFCETADTNTHRPDAMRYFRSSPGREEQLLRGRSRLAVHLCFAPSFLNTHLAGGFGALLIRRHKQTRNNQY